LLCLMDGSGGRRPEGRRRRREAEYMLHSPRRCYLSNNPGVHPVPSSKTRVLYLAGNRTGISRTFCLFIYMQLSVIHSIISHTCNYQSYMLMVQEEHVCLDCHPILRVVFSVQLVQLLQPVGNPPEDSAGCMSHDSGYFKQWPEKVTCLVG
jgi:hypothetical protein